MAALPYLALVAGLCLAGLAFLMERAAKRNLDDALTHLHEAQLSNADAQRLLAEAQRINAATAALLNKE